MQSQALFDMITYEYKKDENIIYVKRSGELGVAEILEYINGIGKTFSGLDRLFVLEDCTGSNTSLSHHEDLQKIRDAIADLSANYKLLKIAMIVEDPADTALNFMYEKLTHGIPNYFFKVFSTVHLAEEWLRMR